MDDLPCDIHDPKALAIARRIDALADTLVGNIIPTLRIAGYTQPEFISIILHAVIRKVEDMAAKIDLEVSVAKRRRGR